MRLNLKIPEKMMRTDRWFSDVEEYAKNAGHFRIHDILLLMNQGGLSISRASVYRAIDKLLKSGKIVQVSNGKERYFEYVQEKIHYHFRCKKCGKLLEFFFEDIEKAIKESSRKLKVILTDQKLVLEGYCSKCSRVRK